MIAMSFTIAELSGRDKTVAFLVKDLEAVDELLVCACGLESILTHQNLQEGIKLDRASSYSFLEENQQMLV